MKAVIKSESLADAGLIRSHRAALPMSPSFEPDTENDPLRARIVQLEAELKRATDTARRHEVLLTAAAERGNREGYQQGRLDAEKSEAQRLEVLRASAQNAACTFADSLADAETLAVLLARACLETMFATAEGRAEMICDLIRTQLVKLTGDTVVLVKVSYDDFPDEEAATSLATSIGLDRLRIEINRSMESGEIVMELSLGRIELGIGQQWSSLRQLIDDWTLVGAPS